MACRRAARKIAPVPDQPLPLSPPPDASDFMSKLLPRLIWVAVGITIGLTVLGVVRGKSKVTPTDTRSASLRGDAAKIEFLKRYLLLPSEVEATEFHIVYKENNKGMMPGPADFDIRTAVKVPPDKVALWTKDMGSPKPQPFDVAWAYELLPKEDRWTIHSPPTYYEHDRVQVVTFAPEGIVFKRVRSD